MVGKALVVDDDPAIREVVSEALEDEGYEVVTAGDGAEALAAAQQHQPEVILLDMRMPVVDGWEFARRYQQTPGPHASIVVMTAAQDAPKWCRQVNGDGCLPKPFEIDALLATVERPRHAHPPAA
jgi:CheY-like chemotaxis protein